MLERIFISVIITSLAGTLLSVILWLLKPVTRRTFSASWNYYIWVCVLAVMVIPVRVALPETEVAALPQTEIAPELPRVEITETVPLPSVGNIPVDAEIPADRTVVTDTEKTTVEKTYDKPDTLKQLLPTASVLWIIIASVIFALKLVGYLAFILHIRKTSYSADIPQIKSGRVSVKINSRISSPLMTGVFKPLLLLPDTALTEEQLDNIVLHEMTHFKRRDMLVKWFSMIVKSIHFFNPTVYFISKQLEEECEISCDAAVVKDMTRERELSYVNTIIALLSENHSKHIPLTTGMAGNKKALKKRFLLIKNKKRIGKTAVFISIAVATVLVIAAILLGGIINGNIIKDKDEDENEDEDGAVTLLNNDIPEVMPEPFSFAGEEHSIYYASCEWLLDGVPVELIRLVDTDDFEAWRAEHNIFVKAPSSLRDHMNMYSFIIEFDISDEEVLSALSVYLQSKEQSIAISKEEMDIILSKDDVRVAERFASQYSIVVGENVYAPQWMYENSVDAYKKAGITPEMIKEKLPWYWDINFTEEARQAFENKLGAYLGEKVSLIPDPKSFQMSAEEREAANGLLVEYQNYCAEQIANEGDILKPKDYFSKEEYALLKKNERYHALVFEGVRKQDFAIGEYSLDWLASSTIQDYEAAGITVSDLYVLLSQMKGFEESREYDWILSCYNRMIEDMPKSEIGAKIKSVDNGKLIVKDIYDGKEYEVIIRFEPDHTPQIDWFYWIRGIIDEEEQTITVYSVFDLHCPQRYEHTD